jgi:hypothetical protein
MTDRPIGVGETSCPSKGGNKAQWILDAFDTIANEFTHMTEVTCCYYTIHACTITYYCNSLHFVVNIVSCN